MSHFQAIHLAFTLILGMEVMELILTISGSLSKSLGKQFEVMALILLRDAFKELSKLPEPVSLTSGIEPVVHIASAGLGALIDHAAGPLSAPLTRHGEPTRTHAQEW